MKKTGKFFDIRLGNYGLKKINEKFGATKIWLLKILPSPRNFSHGKKLQGKKRSGAVRHSPATSGVGP